MKARSIISLVIALLLVAAINVVAFGGINLFGVQYYPGALQEGGIRQGIDLAGGSVITFEAAQQQVTKEEMDTVETIIRTRLASEGYTEAIVSRNQSDPRKIRVEIPDIFDTEAAAELLGKTAKLTFVDSAGNEVLTGNDVKTARYKYGAISEGGNSQHYVELEFNETAVEKFAAATKEAAAKTASSENFIAIMMDEAVVSQPYVWEEINSSSCVISGSFDQESASTLASQIKSGQLPFDLNRIEQSTVGPELGEKALSSSVWAALLGVILVMLFMLIFYRLPGLVADIALLFYVGILALILGLFHVNLTLSGIAGIILSIGMAVDANVIIFERVKEELRAGKTVRASVDSGFKRALTAIIDANITTIIATVVLWLSGVSTVQGFAITLFIGVVLSMFTAITVTKFLLRQIVGLDVKNPKLYGA